MINFLRKNIYYLNRKYRNFFSVRFVASLMLELDVQIQTDIAAVDFGAFVVRARIGFFNLL
jgi:hypothetical protein